MADQQYKEQKVPNAPPPAYPTQYDSQQPEPWPQQQPEWSQQQPQQWGQQPPQQWPQQPPPAQQPVSAAQLGEQYRSEMYARCARGLHDSTRKFGICGILTAIFLFPIGLICLFMDSEKVCSRCGQKLP